MDTREIKTIKNVSDIQRVMNGNQVIWQGETSFKSLSIGTKVVDPNTKYYGQPIVWIIADKNHSGYPTNTVTLISEKLLCLKAFDAIEPNNRGSDRRYSGNNYYRYSNLLQWLNSASINWYSAQHGADAPPNSSNVIGGWNPYDSEPGFLYNFSADFKNAMTSTNLKTLELSTFAEKILLNPTTVTSKIFLASTTEVGLANEHGIVEGTRFPTFDGGESRKAYPTQEAVSKSNYTSSDLNVSRHFFWWLRTPDGTYLNRSRAVGPTGFQTSGLTSIGNMGVRPLCNVKDDSTFFEVIK